MTKGFLAKNPSILIFLAALAAFTLLVTLGSEALGLSFISTSMACQRIGATAIAVDVLPDTLCIDPAAVLANNLDSMGFHPVTHAVFGMLGLEEQEAAWSRVQKIQRLLELPGEVLVIDNPQKWTDTEVTERMGLNPAKLPSEAANMLKIESSWDARKATRAHAMQYGLPGSLGLGQAITLAQVEDKKAIPSHAALPAHDGAALFDQKRLGSGLLFFSLDFYWINLAINLNQKINLSRRFLS